MYSGYKKARVALLGTLSLQGGGEAAGINAACPADQGFPEVCIIDSAMAVDNAFRDEVQPGPLTYRGNPVPADPQGAAGPNSLCAVADRSIECLRKDGSTIFGPTDLYDMFASFNPYYLHGAKIRYDTHQGRFVLVVVAELADYVSSPRMTTMIVAVSTTDDPMTTSNTDWIILSMDVSLEFHYASEDWTPGLAVDEEAIYITTDGVAFLTSEIYLWIIPKGDLYDGYTPTWTFHNLTEVGAISACTPAMVRGRTGIPNDVGTYIVGVSRLNDGRNEFVQIIEIKNPLTNPTFQAKSINVGDIDSFLEVWGAPQGGHYYVGLVVPERFHDAVWANGVLWVVFTIDEPSTGEKAAYWIKLDADGYTWPPTLADHGPIDGEAIGVGTYTYIPSVDANEKGVAAFGFSASSDDIYIGAYVTIRDDPVDAPGTVRSPKTVKAGQGPFDISLGAHGISRWGTCSGMSMDPVDNDCFWAFNMYAGPNNYTSSQYDIQHVGEWKTAWARLCKKCLKLNTPCVYSSKKNVCCRGQQLVCRNRGRGGFKCRKCLAHASLCTKSYECCSKRCKTNSRNSKKYCA